MEAERPLEKGMSLSQALQERKRQAAQVPSRHQASPLAIATVLAPKKASLGPLVTLPFTEVGRRDRLEVSGSGSTQELKINFPEVGLKKLLASVAPIEKK